MSFSYKRTLPDTGIILDRSKQALVQDYFAAQASGATGPSVELKMKNTLSNKVSRSYAVCPSSSTKRNQDKQAGKGSDFRRTRPFETRDGSINSKLPFICMLVIMISTYSSSSL